MRGDDTIIGGSEKGLIINYSGADSLMGGAGSDFIFTPEYDLDQYDGTDTVNGGEGNDLLWIDDGDTATGGYGSGAFVTYANTYDPNYEPITITDFNRNEDTIEIGVFSWPLDVPIDQNRLDTQMDFEPEKDKLVIRFDESIEQAANPDRVIMTYDIRADATNVYADGKKVAEIFGVYPNE